MKSISKLLPVVLFGVFGLVGCATHLQLPTVSDLAYTGVSARVLEQYRNYSAEPWEVVETPSVPAGYWKSGFTNFSGQDNPEENIAGLSDPTVYEVEFYEDWRTIEPEEGLYNWKPIDDQIALWGAYGKKVAIRIVTASHNTMETPQWLHEQYHVRKITDGLWLDFDQPKKIYELSGGVISDQRDVAITGRRSLYGDAPGALMSIKEGKLERSKLYGIEFDYRSLAPGPTTSRPPASQEVQKLTGTICLILLQRKKVCGSGRCSLVPLMTMCCSGALQTVLRSQWIISLYTNRSMGSVRP